MNILATGGSGFIGSKTRAAIKFGIIKTIIAPTGRRG
jgi:UDP-glucose 4-epimerase